MSQKNLILYPTDPNCIDITDVKLYHQYFYFQMNGSGGREEPFYYSVPGIKTFYVDSAFLMDGWYKRSYKRELLNKSVYSEIGSFSRCSRGGLNGSPVFIKEKYKEDLNKNKEGVLFESKKIVKDVVGGGGYHFLPGTRKTTYIYSNKLDCLKGLKKKLEEDLERLERSLSYLRNQFLEFCKNPIKPFTFRDEKSLPNFLPPGSKIWIGWFDTGWYPGACLRGNCCVMDGFVAINELKPIEITINKEISDWNKGGFYISSDDLSEGVYNRTVCVGRTKEECEFSFFKKKKNTIQTEINRISSRKRDVLEKSLISLKKKIEKES